MSEEDIKNNLRYTWNSNMDLEEYVTGEVFRDRLGFLEEKGFIQGFNYNGKTQTISIKPTSNIFSGVWISYGRFSYINVRTNQPDEKKGRSLLKLLFCQDFKNIHSIEEED